VNKSSRTTFEIGEETEASQGWSYELIRHHPNGSISTHRLGLSWADHELILGGAHAPSKTIGAVCVLLGESDRLGLVPEHALGDLPARLDVSTIRRLIPNFDALVRERIDQDAPQKTGQSDR